MGRSRTETLALENASATIRPLREWLIGQALRGLAQHPDLFKSKSPGEIARTAVSLAECAIAEMNART